MQGLTNNKSILWLLGGLVLVVAVNLLVNVFFVGDSSSDNTQFVQTNDGDFTIRSFEEGVYEITEGTNAYYIQSTNELVFSTEDPGELNDSTVERIADQLGYDSANIVIEGPNPFARDDVEWVLPDSEEYQAFIDEKLETRGF